MGFRVSLSIALGLALAGPAAAQFSDSYNFIQGVKDRDGDKVQTIVNRVGAGVFSARDTSSGETATHIVVKRHDQAWLAFLLAKGAPADARDRAGNTPLLVAAQTGDADAARTLIGYDANVNASNSNGETPLVLAVHRRDIPFVRLLIASGANPAIRDTIAGKSAADYAGEDTRGGPIAKILAEAKPKTPARGVAGPTR